jgi:hypothetical protein
MELRKLKDNKESTLVSCISYTLNAAEKLAPPRRCQDPWLQLARTWVNIKAPTPLDAPTPTMAMDALPAPLRRTQVEEIPELIKARYENHSVTRFRRIQAEVSCLNNAFSELEPFRDAINNVVNHKFIEETINYVSQANMALVRILNSRAGPDGRLTKIKYRWDEESETLVEDENGEF